MCGLSDRHIAGKKLFLVQGDKPQLMDWEECGLRISVREGSLSPSETTEIAVIALVGGHFKYMYYLYNLYFLSLLPSFFRFPKNTRLVSAVYAISSSHLLKSLKLEVQHCIDLSDPSLCKYLKFAVAPVHTSSLPYHFSIVEGGEFPANSRYGSIERSKFCLVGMVAKEKNGGQDNGEQSNGGQEQNNGEQQEQSNGHEDSGDEGKGGGNQQGGSDQQQQGGAKQQGGERGGGGGGGEGEENCGHQELLKESHEEEQQKGGEAHQKRGKEKQQHGSEHHRQPTQEEKENGNDKENSDSDDVIKAPEFCTESDQSTHSTISKPL